ncbi:hypothetical protein D779_2160 [Imhoffiella purpurea]|uniref:Uncharacterized protein n=1 Tax=Imhoffiella purpurea TaxID=1249627 RepID=W9VCR6_9GAMM|nr:hypothetical protein D779_2160 [Imhoffiella purpurea]
MAETLQIELLEKHKVLLKSAARIPLREVPIRFDTATA